MRIKRLKKYRKYINFFKVVYKFQAPFKILLDGNFFHQASLNNFELKGILEALPDSSIPPKIDQILLFYTSISLYLC